MGVHVLHKGGTVKGDWMGSPLGVTSVAHPAALSGGAYQIELVEASVELLELLEEFIRSHWRVAQPFAQLDEVHGNVPKGWVHVVASACHWAPPCGSRFFFFARTVAG
jgi:hypothetical protein